MYDKLYAITIIMHVLRMAKFSASLFLYVSVCGFKKTLGMSI